MSYQKENKIIRLNKQIRKQQRRLERLERIEYPPIWTQISIRLTKLDLVCLKRKLNMEIQTY